LPAYRYEALDAGGRAVNGVLQAETARHARGVLRAQGLVPAAVEEVSPEERTTRARGRRIAPGDLPMFTRQLATLVESGLTIEQALGALIDEADSTVSREVLSGVRAEIQAGLPLARAMAAFPRSFPDYYRAVVHGGEESGALPAVLAHLADYLDASQALRQRTLLALLYPMLVTGVAVLVVAGLLAYVVPQVVQVFQQSRQALPVLTRILIAASDALRVAWPWLLGIGLVATFAGRRALRNAAFRLRVDAALLRVPGLGPILRSIDTSRFAATLAILVRGGVPLLSSLDAAARVMTNGVLRAATDETIVRVREGVGLARALSATRVFPALLGHMIASGEASGRLEQMLERAATLERRTLERRLAVFLTIFEPALILAMGGVVLLIVLAILLPIIEINQLVR
jgi:general secretion pathway protein F